MHSCNFHGLEPAKKRIEISAKNILRPQLVLDFLSPKGYINIT